LNDEIKIIINFKNLSKSRKYNRKNKVKILYANIMKEDELERKINSKNYLK
jgi:hypothetical protein